MSDETLGIAPKRDVTLPPSRINTDEFVRTFWCCTVEPHILRSDFLDPTFWAHIANRFRQFDRIEVRYDDGQAWGEFLVLSATKTSAVVKELTWKKLITSEKAKIDPAYKYTWRGPHAKHSIVRVKDNTVMVEKLETHSDALRWLSEHLGKI